MLSWPAEFANEKLESKEQVENIIKFKHDDWIYSLAHPLNITF